MAEQATTQDNTLVAADDLMRDRARQFVEFLDDEVRLDLSFGPLFVSHQY